MLAVLLCVAFLCKYQKERKTADASKLRLAFPPILFFTFFHVYDTLGISRPRQVNPFCARPQHPATSAATHKPSKNRRKSRRPPPPFVSCRRKVFCFLFFCGPTKSPGAAETRKEEQSLQDVRNNLSPASLSGLHRFLRRASLPSVDCFSPRSRGH